MQEDVDNDLVSLSEPSICFDDKVQYKIDVDLNLLRGFPNNFYHDHGSNYVTVDFCTKVTGLLGLKRCEKLTNFRFVVNPDVGPGEAVYTPMPPETLPGPDEDDPLTTITVDFASQYTVEGCICAENSVECKSEAVLYNQNDIVYLCLKPNKEEVEIKNFQLRMERGTFEYKPVEMGVHVWKENAVTDVVEETDDMGISVIKISTPIVAGLVQATDDTSIEVQCTGLVNLGIKTTNGRTGTKVTSFYASIGFIDNSMYASDCRGSNNFFSAVVAKLLRSASV